MKRIDERGLSIIVFALFFSWLLAFPFQGQILHALLNSRQLPAGGFIFGTIAAHLAGLFLCGFFIKTALMAKRLMLCSIITCIFASAIFFLPPSFLWMTALLLASFLSGACVAAWGIYFKICTPKNEKLKTAADILIYSNILMIMLNMAALYISPYLGLGLSMVMLGAAFPFVLKLPGAAWPAGYAQSEPAGYEVSIARPLAFLCLFVAVIAINSGLMYQVVIPAFTHLEWLAGWYWAVPYIVALYILKSLPRKTNRAYILYVAIAMTGFSFILFMLLDRSAASYFVVDTLMLGAFGIFDLFWWSILGEMINFSKYPARVFGMGLSANVLGLLLGELMGFALTSAEPQSPHITLLALAVVCVTLVILPLLHKSLTALLKDQEFLTIISEMAPREHGRIIMDLSNTGLFTKRESEITALLLKGKTYRMISAELHVSENTIKTHVKNIYAKSGVQSKAELANILLEAQPFSTE